MEKLKDFARQDMIQQIMLLEEIKEAREFEAIPELMALYAEPGLLDQAVDEMLYHNLFELLAGQAGAVAVALSGGSLRVQTLAVRRAGEDGQAEVLPALTALLQQTTDPEMTSEIVRALGGFQSGGLTGILLPYLLHDNDAVAAWAMNSVVALNDPAGRVALETMVSERAEAVKASGVCDLKTAQAIGSIARYGDEQAARSLSVHIHHETAALRRVVTNALAGMGEVALPALRDCILAGDKDEKILAANIIGWTGSKKGADLLIAILDQGKELESNLRFAIYEALGRIPSMRSFIALGDGLSEQDEMVLMAVMTGLNDQCNPGIVKVLDDFLDKNDAQAERLVKTMVTARARNIFQEVYRSGRHRRRLIEVVRACGDAEAREVFRVVLQGLGTPEATADLAQLREPGTVAGQNCRVVAADDSKAMLFFYKGAAADLGIDLVTAMDGKEALQYLRTAAGIDLLITDMNMPNMDGIELTRELRRLPQWATLPILMATTESESSQIEQAQAAGVNGFISKPFGKEELKAKIAEVFATSHAK